MNLQNFLRKYTDDRMLELIEFNEGKHFRIIDQVTATIDIWPTTGSYYVQTTNYVDIAPGKISERGGEKGKLPFSHKKAEKFLDKLFYAADMLE